MNGIASKLLIWMCVVFMKKKCFYLGICRKSFMHEKEILRNTTKRWHTVPNKFPKWDEFMKKYIVGAKFSFSKKDKK